MDIFNLIRAVRCREPIWNRQHPQYKDRECSLLLWTEVANETGVDVETARCKWRGLRDTFRVQLRKLNQSTKNGGSNPLTWEYFDEMVFVKDQIYIDINRRKYHIKDRIEEMKADSEGLLRKDDEDDSMEGCIDLSKNKSILQRVEYPIQSVIEQAIRFRMEQPTPNPELVPYSQLSTITANYSGPNNGGGYSTEEEIDFQMPANFCVAEVTEDTETRLEFDSDTNNTGSPRSEVEEQPLVDRLTSTPLLQKKLKALQDDNYCFLMSILPQMKNLPIKQKLFVRIKIQELLFNEIMKMENKD
uniref:Transcription factor Adf-1 n=3 Tax=Lygus hesperus TaxID=30085 RepID=A0A0A9XTB5_LYGHE